MVEITDVIVLDITINDIIESIQRAKQRVFIDNLRDRDDLLRFDCKVRGYIGEKGITKLLDKYHISYKSGPEPTTYTSDVDIEINSNQRTYDTEVKTSLIPLSFTSNRKEPFIKNCIAKCDIKIFKVGVSQQPQNLNRDIYMQIYYSEVTDDRETFLKSAFDRNNDIFTLSDEEIFNVLNYNSFIENTFFVGWIDKKTLVSNLEAMDVDKRTYTTKDKRTFWTCKIKTSNKPTDFIQFLRQECPLCGGKLVLRHSKNGNDFLGCSNFATKGCTYTSSVK